LCHPERSFVIGEAYDKAESKDLYAIRRWLGKRFLHCERQLQPSSQPEGRGPSTPRELHFVKL